MQRKKKKQRSTCWIRRNNTAVSTGVLKARHLWTNLALSCVAGTHSFEKQYKNRLMQNRAMEITAGRAMRHRAILGDFASPDSQIAMETSIIGCRIARFCFSVTGLLGKLWAAEIQIYPCCCCYAVLVFEYFALPGSRSEDIIICICIFPLTTGTVKLQIFVCG